MDRTALPEKRLSAQLGAGALDANIDALEKKA